MSLKRATPGILRDYRKIERKVSKKGDKKYRVVREDVQDKRLKIDREDESVKVVVCLGPVGFCESFVQGIHELDRILKYGGKIALACWTKMGRDYKDGQYYFPTSQFFKILGRHFRTKEVKELWSDGERTLRAFIGEK